MSLQGASTVLQNFKMPFRISSWRLLLLLQEALPSSVNSCANIEKRCDNNENSCANTRNSYSRPILKIVMSCLKIIVTIRKIVVPTHCANIENICANTENLLVIPAFFVSFWNDFLRLFLSNTVLFQKLMLLPMDTDSKFSSHEHRNSASKKKCHHKKLDKH